MKPKNAQESLGGLENKGFLALNPDQERAVGSAPTRPLLIVAGAGTGKTATLTARVAFLIKKGVPPGQICAITFTNKAAREMERRIGRSGPFIGTFHALGARILRRYAKLLGRTPNFVIFDDHDSFSLVKKILKDMDRRKESPALILDKISAIKSGSREYKEEPALIQNVFARYEDALESHNAFDFDDLLSKVVMLFRKNDSALKKYQEQFRYILVDEYQDLNNAQYELLRLLAGGGASVSVVGDAEQTIYSWRGSNIEIFLRFPESWQDSEVITLTQNYRSTQNILRAASGVIQNNIYDTKVKRATDLWTENGEGPKIGIHEFLDEDAEAAWVAEKIGEKILRGAQDDKVARTHAILYRTNAQSRALEQALLRRRIPYRVYGGLKFYERREIKDILAALRWAMNPQDAVARERLEKALTKTAFRNLAEELSQNKDFSPLALINTFLKAVDYLDYVRRQMTNPTERRENIEELIHFAASYTDLPKFLEEIALLQATDNMANSKGQIANGSNEVSLMTIHLAKGLEFDRVFVAGVSEGLLPHSRSMDSKEELQEERRLMYVAMTRAREELFLSFYDIPSRFLGEIPEETVEFQTELGDYNRRSLNYADEEYEERYISLD